MQSNSCDAREYKNNMHWFYAPPPPPPHTHTHTLFHFFLTKYLYQYGIPITITFCLGSISETAEEHIIVGIWDIFKLGR